jgi:glycosyltransferase involved in cell wall biosynthesis
VAEYWGLAAYPPSAAWLQRVAATLDGPLQVTTLGDLRPLGAAGLVTRVRSVRADVGLLLEDGEPGPLRPALLTLLALTRCRTLETIGAEGTRRAVSRRTVWSALGRMIGATLGGVAAAWACWRELNALDGPGTRTFPRPIRSVAVLRTNLWHGVKVGGSVGHFAGVVNALQRRGVSTEVFAPEPQPMIDAGVRMHSIAASPDPAYPYELNYYRYHRRFVAALAARLAAARPDAIYHRLSLGSWAGVAVARRLGIPVIVEYNGSEVWVSRHWGRALRLERLAARGEAVGLRAADMVIVVSQPLADEVRRHGVPAERVVIHPNGVDTDLFDPARFTAADRAASRRNAGIPEHATVCTFVGTFGRWHGVDVLAAAIRELAQDRAWIERHTVRFLLIGDGAMMPLARQELAALSDLVTFAGLRPQAETPAWLAASDVLLSPHVPNPDGSRFFGSPTKLFEYMAMGRAIVASALEQIGEVLQPAFRAADLPQGAPPLDAGERVAILSTPGDVREFVAGIRFAVEHPEIRARLGANARVAAQARYTWDAHVEALLARCQTLT